MWRSVAGGSARVAAAAGRGGGVGERGRGVLPSRLPSLVCSWREKNTFVTTPIYYANAEPHLGHLYTSVLSDALHRWNELKWPDDIHLQSTGTDEHGIKIYRAAQAAGMEPKAFCDKVSSRFSSMASEFGLGQTDFIRTTEARHRDTVERIWKTLVERGHITKSSYGGWYSVTDECFHPEGELEDTERDGKPCKVVRVSQTPVEWVEEENYMFDLAPFKEKIRRWLMTSDVIRPTHYLPTALRCLDVEDRVSVSRDRKRLPWGHPVPGDDSQTIYVWLDALVNYVTVSGWPNDGALLPPSCQLLGKDIVKFHAVYWPAFLLAAGLPLPERLFVHGHWLVDGTKMSKSIGNVVSPSVAAAELGVEGLKYFLLKQGLPHVDANYTPLKASHVVTADLVNNYGNLLSRATAKSLNPHGVYPYCDVLALEQEMKLNATPLINDLNGLRDKVSACYDDLLFYKAMDLIMSVGKHANTFFQIHEPWKMDKDQKLSTVLFVAYETVRIAAVLLQPVAPGYAAHALDRLGIARDRRHLGTAVFGGGKELAMTGRKLGEDKGPFIQRHKKK